MRENVRVSSCGSSTNIGKATTYSDLTFDSVQVDKDVAPEISFDLRPQVVMLAYVTSSALRSQCCSRAEVLKDERASLHVCKAAESSIHQCSGMVSVVQCHGCSRSERDEACQSAQGIDRRIGICK